MTSKLFIAGLVFLLPAIANASVIKQRPFDYSFDVANTMRSDLFVICSNSPDDRISTLPALPQLALRLSQNDVRKVESKVEPKITPMPATETRRACVNCLLGTVHFQLDSAELSQKEQAKLDELIKGICAGTEVRLDGYTCDLGSASHNMSLSMKRARVVAEYLRGKNILVGNIDGKGMCCPVAENRPLNRRVEITIQQKEKK